MLKVETQSFLRISSLFPSTELTHDWMKGKEDENTEETEEDEEEGED